MLLYYGTSGKPRQGLWKCSPSSLWCWFRGIIYLSELFKLYPSNGDSQFYTNYFSVTCNSKKWTEKLPRKFCEGEKLCINWCLTNWISVSKSLPHSIQLLEENKWKHLYKLETDGTFYKDTESFNHKWKKLLIELQWKL